jgi:hypothetical protein
VRFNIESGKGKRISDCAELRRWPPYPSFDINFIRTLVTYCLSLIF